MQRNSLISAAVTIILFVLANVFHVQLGKNGRAEKPADRLKANATTSD